MITKTRRSWTTWLRWFHRSRRSRRSTPDFADYGTAFGLDMSMATESSPMPLVSAAPIPSTSGPAALPTEAAAQTRPAAFY